MSRTASSSLNAVSKRPLKSPLRTSALPRLGPAPASGEAGGSSGAGVVVEPEVTVRQLRVMQISEFTAWLRTQTNKHKRRVAGAADEEAAGGDGIDAGRFPARECAGHL
jgi:hypothetical protein